MKSLGTLLVLFSALMLVACQEKPVSPDTPYIIEGYVPNVEDGMEIALSQYLGNIYEVIARDTIENGKFYFKEQIRDNNTQLALRVNKKEYNGSSSLFIYVQPGVHVKVTGLDHYTELWEVDSRIPRQLLYNELREVSRTEIIELSDLDIALTDENGALRSWEDANKLSKAYQVVVAKQLQHMMNMNVSEALMEELLHHLRFNASKENFPHKEMFLSLYEKLSDEQKQSILGLEINALLNPPQQARVGKSAPDADFFDLQGNLHHISEFKGKYILLDFWSGGCGPCLQAFPKMKELYEEAGNRLSIISISIDPEKYWRTASKKHELTWDNWNELKGRAGLYTNYRINAIPFYVLINPEGKIVETIRGFNKNYLMEAIGLK